MTKFYHKPGLSHHERVAATKLIPTKVIEDGDCLEWPNARDPKGYGRVGGYRTKHIMFTHRAALENKLGRPIKEGMHVLHRCDNPPCCNPDHLYEGTQVRNIEDARVRDRVKHGEGHWRRRLTEEDVRWIREQVGKMSQRAMARELGVHDNTVRDVIKGRTWVRVG